MTLLNPQRFLTIAGVFWLLFLTVSEARTEAHQLIIVYTNDVHGEIEPCG